MRYVVVKSVKINLVHGKPKERLVHFANEKQLIQKQTACGLKKWDAATGELDWVTCKDCMRTMKIKRMRVHVRRIA